MRRLPIPILLAVAVFLITNGGFFATMGFEGEVLNASFFGQGHMGSYYFGVSPELRWFVYDGTRVVEISAWQREMFTGYIKAVPVYYTYVDGNNWYAWSWPYVRFTGVGRNPSSRVVLSIGANTWSLYYQFYIDVAAGVAVCDPDNPQRSDPICSQCSTIVYDLVLKDYICYDYFLFKIWSVEVDIGGVRNCAIKPTFSVCGGTPWRRYTEGGRHIRYVGTRDCCLTEKCFFKSVCVDGGQYPIKATAEWHLSPDPVTIPIGVPPQIPINYRVENNAPFIMSNDDLLARLNTWSRPYKTLYARYVIMGCDGCLTAYPFLCDWPHVIAGWQIISSSDTKESLDINITAVGSTDDWIPVPRRQCRVLFSVDVGPVYVTQLEYSQYQEVSYLGPMWMWRHDRAGEAIISGLVGESKPFTLYLPLAHAVTAYGNVKLRAVGEYMDVPDWVRPYATPQCPVVEGNRWPGLVGGCYGARLSGLVVHGIGYVELS